MKRRPIQQRIGDAIRKHRKASPYNQEEFADHIKMHRAQYGQLEQGKKDIRMTTLERVCEGLGVPMSVILKDAEADA
jgi:transcriptional regulator with XRE-family HTH domain